MRKHIPTALALLGLLIASYAFGYQQGAHDMAEHVQAQLTASTAQTDTFDDCEGSNISSASECYGDE